MRPRLFTISSALSLVLCLAAAALWARSYSRTDLGWLSDRSHRTFCVLQSGRGRVQLCLVHEDGVPDPNIHASPTSRWAYGSDYAADIYPLPHAFMGLQWGRRVDVPPWYSLRPAITVPEGFVVALFAALPALYVYRRAVPRRRERRRKSRGECLHCGYSLAGNTSGRCPECGTVRRDEMNSKLNDPNSRVS